jgi:hypothetical protein
MKNVDYTSTDYESHSEIQPTHNVSVIDDYAKDDGFIDATTPRRVMKPVGAHRASTHDPKGRNPGC